jgi:Carboxypeptidase regulatory-like domain/TonB-dependent Receptor Plug Domain
MDALLRHRTLVAAFLLGTVHTLSDAPLANAQALARLSGRVVDSASAAAVPGALIILAPNGRRASSDSAGLYTIQGLPAGTHRLQVRAIGFAPVELTVELEPGADARQTIALPSLAPQSLDPVTVAETTTPAERRLVDFERRRRTGRGQYLTEEEIRRAGAANLRDALRGMRGVTEECWGSDGGCRVHMVRARHNCPPEYVVDGHTNNTFGALTPIRDIVALEVYTGPSDVPGEFAGTYAGCGVVVIWTRSGPAPRH